MLAQLADRKLHVGAVAEESVERIEDDLAERPIGVAGAFHHLLESRSSVVSRGGGLDISSPPIQPLVSQWDLVTSRCDGKDTSFAACRPVLTRRYSAALLGLIPSGWIAVWKICLVIGSPTVCQNKIFTLPKHNCAAL